MVNIVRTEYAIKCLRNWRAAGLEGIIVEIFKIKYKKQQRMMTNKLSEYQNRHPVQNDWKTACISSLYKKGIQTNAKII